MASKYIWESEREAQDVIKSFIALTDKTNTIDFGLPLRNYKSFKYKRIGSEKYRFTLWYYFAFNQLSYWPAPVYGIISATKDGCIIETQSERYITTLGCIMIPAYVAVGYYCAIAMLVSEGAKSMPFTILLGGFVTLALARFLYTRKKWMECDVLWDIIYRAAYEERQQ